MKAIATKAVAVALTVTAVASMAPGQEAAQVCRYDYVCNYWGYCLWRYICGY